ncbi:IclR family transcriptional regulator (plasmid) [Xanthobacter dioxanivorans]|uniref:IclR family transcriptional regulator n=2 Tax=Pseudomonadota TaxID=1224 RepID=A0A974PUV9_9HYPH|nr:IclR family transcriptional regulator [Xanthobacter dioxanivorans]QRG10258.1 IclR family transcriptional regulator [Xanthobacter dioxanivorans]
MKSTERTAKVLRLFTRTSPELGTSEVARMLGVATSSAHELLNGLADAGLLRKQAPGRFRLGPMITALNQVMASTDLMIEAARPVVSDFAHRYGQTCHVVELMDRHLLSLVGQEGTNAVRVSRDIVSPETPVHATAPGRILLAELPTPALLSILGRIELTQNTPRTIAQKSLLRDTLSKVRDAAYAEETGEFLTDLATTAAPIRNHAGLCMGTFCLFIPAGRFEAQPRAYANITREAAHKISTRLGWDPRPPSTGGQIQTRRNKAKGE